MRTVVIALGVIVFVAGVFLRCATSFGFFRTIPFAGYLTLVAGGVVYKAGKKMNPPS